MSPLPTLKILALRLRVALNSVAIVVNISDPLSLALSLLNVLLRCLLSRPLVETTLGQKWIKMDMFLY